MSLPKIQDINKLTLKEIEEKILELKKEILTLNIKKATKQNIKPHTLKHIKHKIAQLLTLKTSKKYN